MAKQKTDGQDAEKARQKSGSELPPSKSSEAESLMDALQAQNFETLETLTRNLGDAVTRMGALGATAVDGVMADDARPLRADPYGLAPYAADVATRLAGNPEKLMAAHQELWQGFAEIWADAIKSSLNDGTAQAKPDPKYADKRFADPDWHKLPMFNLLQKTYLHTANWFTGLIDHVDGIDDMTRRKATFFNKQFADAFAPSNFLMTNPVALREALRTGGQSVLRGLANLEQDLKRGQGRLTPAQVDERPFKIGENIAITPGKVIHRGEILEIIQYDPVTPTVFATPILFFPPWINKFYILDMRQDNSMVKWLTEQGHSVFVVSWLNPGVEHAEKTFEDYSRLGIYEALDVVTKATGQDKINTVGYCIGGTLLASTMAVMAQTGDKRVNSATFFASQSDFEEAGDLKVFTDDAAIQYIKDEIEHAGGVLDATVMGETFNFLRANDLVWSFVVNNYLMGKDPKPFDLLFWNADQTRMPKALHLYYLDNFYRQNRLGRGEMTLSGYRLNLKDVETPIYMQSSKEDHIAPWRSIYRGAKLFGGPVRMILAGSGHIAGVINHPEAKKYHHWLPPETMKNLPDTSEQWQGELVEHKGSWWPDWAKWLGERSGEHVPARVPGDHGVAVIGEAPGTYVLVKSSD